MSELPELLRAAQSFTFDIQNRPDGKFAVLTFFALPNAKGIRRIQLSLGSRCLTRQAAAFSVSW
jgi:hypothetical protein